jgi:hypothetical protein
MGWAEFGNGDLLLEAEAQFNALVTTDQNLRYQQNFKIWGFRIFFSRQLYPNIALALSKRSHRCQRKLQ